MRKPIFAIAGLALLASGAFASLATVASGADHRDSPLNQSNPTADINDVYAFRSPENANNVVFVLSLNPLIAPGDNRTRGVFDPAVQYQIHIDRNGDLADDALGTIRMTNDPPQLTLEVGDNALVIPITPPDAAPRIATSGPIKGFAGLRDDPFFFDLAAFQAFIANPQAPARGLRPASAGAPVDTFAGMNIMAIVIEMPVVAVTGGTSANSGTVKAWVSTTKNGARIDRMAIPAINTALIPSAQKDAFNAGDPINDAANFRATGANTIRGLRSAVDPLFGGPTTQDGGPLGGLTADQVAAALIPDVVTIDFSRPLAFPNGRRLPDDVIDADLGIVLNRGGAAGIADGINANDKAFSSSFPYAADPHTATGGAAPSAPQSGGGQISPPNTGDAGLLNDSGTMWTLSGAMLAVALVLGGACVFGVARKRGN